MKKENVPIKDILFTKFPNLYFYGYALPYKS